MTIDALAERPAQARPRGLPAGRLRTETLPASVYRLQFNRGFTFRQAADLVPYLKELGVGAVYCSPYFKAVSGSPHGYDVTDYTALNPELGSDEDFSAFCRALSDGGLRHVLDMVPNHMGIGSENALWMDVLENGRASPYARFFDINWRPVKKELQDKVLLPILGDLYGRVLEGQQLELRLERGRFQLRYGGRLLPVAPETYPLIMAGAAADLKARLGGEHPDLLEYLSIVASLEHLPPRTGAEPAGVLERGREKEVAIRRLAALAGRSDAVQDALAARVRALNGRREDPRSFDELDRLLSRQVYRLSYWRAAADEINYRRFFEINELAAIRMEDPQVFEHCHALVFRLIREGKVHGLRIDHPDGLYDPPTYFRRLQRRYLEEMAAAGAAIPPPPLLVEVEKVLYRKEPLPENWRIHGTVGYDFLNALNGLFIDPAHEKEFLSIHEELAGRRIDFDELVYEKKKLFAMLQMGSEINDLGHRLDEISEGDRRYRDFTLNNLVLAIRETIACFPVYRTYVSPRDAAVSERDAKFIHAAVEKAKSRTPALNPAVYDFLRDVLLLRLEGEVGQPERGLYRDFVLRFQQLTGPIMAKGLEDTAFYAYNVLLPLDEVGGDPTRFGVSREEFHRQNSQRNRQWPASFITTSTHDTKRSEDVRFRLDVLSEVPAEWQSVLAQWSMVNKKHKTQVAGAPEPDPDTENMIYQSLLGAWPAGTPPLPAAPGANGEGPASGRSLGAQTPSDTIDLPAFEERMWGFVLKALREAKVRTDWIRPDAGYEEAVRRFLSGILSQGEGSRFLEHFLPFQSRIADLGRWNSLAALALKAGSPGIVDTYRGSELWDLSLVDPDNRRPVDFGLRRGLLAELRARLDSGVPRERLVAELARSVEDGRVKLYLLWQGLALRERLPELFLGGDYLPLGAAGQREECVVAFARQAGRRWAAVCAGRFFTRLPGEGRRPPVGETAWGETRVELPDGTPPGPLLEVFTGRRVPVELRGGRASVRAAEVFALLPAGILLREEAP